MNRVLRRILTGLGVIVAVVVVGGFTLHLIGGARLARGPLVEPTPVAIPTDEAAIARGAHLADAVASCTGCHAADLGGQVLLEDATFGRIVASNLTSGAGGFAADASIADWVRAVRHGVGRDGRILAVMPSDGFAHLSDADLGAILAYVTGVPPVDRVLPERRLVFPGTAIAGFLMFPDLPANRIGRMSPPTAWPEPGVTSEYGRYLVEVAHCHDCHGFDLKGRAPGSPGPPAGPDLTSTGSLSGWTEAEFLHAIRTGVAPGGRALDADMPFGTYGRMTDDELGAIWIALSEVE